MLSHEAEYIDARPLTTDSSNLLATHGRTIHWVKSRHRSTSNQCPLYPRKRTSLERVGMSALCQKRTYDLCLPLPGGQAVRSISRSWRRQLEARCLRARCAADSIASGVNSSRDSTISAASASA